MPIKHNLTGANFVNGMDGIIEIEITAERICYTILGTEAEMFRFIKSISSKSQNTIYIASRLIVPISNIAEEEEKKRNIHIEVSSELEYIQCSVMCDCKYVEERKIYALLCLTKKDDDTYILKYPEIEMVDSVDPEKSIMDDIGRIFGDVPDTQLLSVLRKNLKLVDITGKNEDVLVYSTRLSQNKRYIKPKPTLALVFE
jgi:hypothetical protein